ncbi:MAG: hypothetical protein KF709_11305 [Gemmatimonadaceae bacterium]|nr:hypothetical protein [Gemmatimonadaceae bacterium]
MSPVRVGIALEGEEIVAVRLRKRAEPLVVSERLQEGEPLSGPVGRLLDLLGAKSKRVMLGAVAGNDLVRFGELFGVSPNATEREVVGEFASEPTSFFIGQRGSLVPGSVWKDGESWYGVVADRELAAVFEEAAAARRCDFAGIAPFVGFDTLALAAEHAARLGPGSQRLVDVLGAERAARARKATRARAMLGAGLVAAVIAFAPLLSATRAEREAAAMVSRAREARATAVSRVSALAAEAPMLTTLAEAGAARGQVLDVLAALSRSMPDSSAVVWFEWRGGSGRAEVVGVDGADVVGALAADPALAGLTLDGSISRETANGQQRDRVRVAWGTARLTSIDRVAR